MNIFIISIPIYLAGLFLFAYFASDYAGIWAIIGFIPSIAIVILMIFIFIKLLKKYGNHTNT